MRLVSSIPWGSRFSLRRFPQRMGAWRFSWADCLRDPTGYVSFAGIAVNRLRNMFCEPGSAVKRGNMSSRH